MNVLKTFLYLFLIFVVSKNIAAQTFEDINVLDFDIMPEGFEYYTEGTFIKYDIGYFDYSLYTKGRSFGFTCQNPSAMKFSRIYENLVSLFGVESFDDDYIPSHADRNDIDYISLLVNLGQAELVKIWDLPGDKRIGLTYKQEKGKTEIFVGFFKKKS